MATIYTIAKKAKVSPSTVRRALNGSGYVSDKVREKVNKIAKQERYVPHGPARSLRNKSTRIIALAIPDLMNPVYPEICNGVHDEAVIRGYQIFYGNSYDSPDSELELIRTFHGNRVDGLILFPNSKTEHESVDNYIKDIHENGVPVVLSGREVAGLDTDSVGIDSVEGVRMIMRYLLRLGHTKIAYISGFPELPVWKDRLQGYKSALKENIISFNPELVFTGEPNFETGYEGSKFLLLNHPEITAIFGGNDLMAMGAFRAAKELNLQVPDELSIAGFDDIAAASIICPSLTTVAQPKYELGQLAARVLLDRIEGKSDSGKPQHITLPCNLEIRDSAAALKAESKVLVPTK